MLRWGFLWIVCLIAPSEVWAFPPPDIIFPALSALFLKPLSFLWFLLSGIFLLLKDQLREKPILLWSGIIFIGVIIGVWVHNLPVDGVKTLSFSEAGKLIRTQDPLIFDLRNPSFFKQWHLASAKSLPGFTFEESTRVAIRRVESHPGRPVILYCYEGLRSRRMAAALIQHFKHQGKDIDVFLIEQSARMPLQPHIAIIPSVRMVSKEVATLWEDTHKATKFQITRSYLRRDPKLKKLSARISESTHPIILETGDYSRAHISKRLRLTKPALHFYIESQSQRSWSVFSLLKPVFYRLHQTQLHPAILLLVFLLGHMLLLSNVRYWQYRSLQPLSIKSRYVSSLLIWGGSFGVFLFCVHFLYTFPEFYPVSGYETISPQFNVTHPPVIIGLILWVWGGYLHWKWPATQRVAFLYQKVLYQQQSLELSLSPSLKGSMGVAVFYLVLFFESAPILSLLTYMIYVPLVLDIWLHHRVCHRFQTTYPFSAALTEYFKIPSDVVSKPTLSKAFEVHIGFPQFSHLAEVHFDSETPLKKITGFEKEWDHFLNKPWMASVLFAFFHQSPAKLSFDEQGVLQSVSIEEHCHVAPGSFTWLLLEYWVTHHQSPNASEFQRFDELLSTHSSALGFSIFQQRLGSNGARAHVLKHVFLGHQHPLLSQISKRHLQSQISQQTALFLDQQVPQYIQHLQEYCEGEHSAAQKLGFLIKQSQWLTHKGAYLQEQVALLHHWVSQEASKQSHMTPDPFNDWGDQDYDVSKLHVSSQDQGLWEEWKFLSQLRQQLRSIYLNTLNHWRTHLLQVSTELGLGDCVFDLTLEELAFLKDASQLSALQKLTEGRNRFLEIQRQNEVAESSSNALGRSDTTSMKQVVGTSMGLVGVLKTLKAGQCVQPEETPVIWRAKELSSAQLLSAPVGSTVIWEKGNVSSHPAILAYEQKLNLFIHGKEAFEFSEGEWVVLHSNGRMKAYCSSSHAWKALVDVQPEDSYGSKIQRLAALQKKGFPVLPGVVLSSTQIQKEDPAQYFHEILTLLSSSEGPLIVRSSSPLEDQPHQSYAGVFESKHGVQTEKDFQEALAQMVQGVPSMNILVQPEVLQACGGVLLTQDRSSSDSQMVLSLSNKGAMDVTQGGVDTQTHMLSKDSPSWIPNLPLSSSHQQTLWTWGHQLEKYWGAPQNIEWGVHQGRLVLFQCRNLVHG